MKIVGCGILKKNKRKGVLCMKGIPVGKEDFKKLMDGNFYYVDKSMFIKDVLQEEVVLYTRPRRFGKTLNMSMLYYFYSNKEKENAYLFDGLEITNDQEVMKHQNKYPVIHITLKEMRQIDFQQQLNDFKELISAQIGEYEELLTSFQLTELERKKINAYYEGEVNLAQLGRSLLFLSQCLEKHYKEKVVVLIDEYDVPLQHAYVEGYYEEMVSFLRNVLSAALKTNSSLKQGVLTGCLRIAKESIFTGLNNFKVNSIFSNVSSDKFGFTPEEVEEMLRYYQLTAYKQEVQEWYDGYVFGKQEMYNPWSMIHYLKKGVVTSDPTPVSFWANSSGNDIVMRYIEQGNQQMKKEFDVLVNKGSIIKKIKPELTYREMDDIHNIYSFLLFTGYLKAVEKVDRNTYRLEIPNEEVREIYKNQFEVAFETYKEKHKDELLQNLQEGNALEANDILNDILQRSISYYDNKESFYHGLLLGLLSEYEVVSNEEAGSGRLDIVIMPKKQSQCVIVIECKHAKDEDDMIDACEEALRQIEEKGYMKKHAYQRYGGVIGYGISFYKKQCYVRKSE